MATFLTISSLFYFGFLLLSQSRLHLIFSASSPHTPFFWLRFD